jgi:hypothetical protein
MMRAPKGAGFAPNGMQRYELDATVCYPRMIERMVAPVAVLIR